MTKIIISSLEKLYCSQCGIGTFHTHGERWNCKLGFVIKKDEQLCGKCAKERIGFKTLTDINNEKKNS